MSRRERSDATPLIRVLIVDDHLSVLWGLERLLSGEKARTLVVGQASNLTDAVRAVESSSPDVILLDLDLDGESAIDAIPILLEKSNARILVLTGVRDPATRDEAVFAGARGVVGKEEPPDNIVKAIEKVHSGELWLDRSATGRVFVELSRRLTEGPESAVQKRVARLTARERDLVRLLTREPETTIAALAKKIHTSENTLRNHLTSIYNKLGVTGRLQLHLFATKHGLG